MDRYPSLAFPLGSMVLFVARTFLPDSCLPRRQDDLHEAKFVNLFESVGKSFSHLLGLSFLEEEF